ncbi:ABC-2 type transport system permease protein [Anaerotaenia torta]|uniref:ABC transporter permease n=1 Tax=Anaerotaenia torta TaxID=433293 RepID=UPI003D1DEBC2
MELKRYLRNPIFYIGAIIVVLGVYSSTSPYLGIHYFNDEGEIHTLEEYSEIADSDIMDGYIPATKEEQYKMGMEKIGQVMMEEFDFSQSQKNELINKLTEKNMSLMEIAEYMEANYSFLSANVYFYEFKMRQASMEEANDYIKTSFSRHKYSNYFSRTYADYFGVYIIFYAIFMFAFLFIRDSKRDIYELLHTKPLKAREYIIGKIIGGMSALGIVVAAITLLFDVVVMLHGRAAGFPVSFWDLWLAVILYIIPNLLMVASVYTAIAVLFKSPLPALPALILYMIYSNMGSRMEDGSFGYKIRKLAILVRFPGAFFETSTPPQAVLNQIILVLCSVFIILLSITVWRRRRVY